MGEPKSAWFWYQEGYIYFKPDALTFIFGHTLLNTP